MTPRTCIRGILGLGLALAAATTAHARVVTHPHAQFQVALPDDFAVQLSAQRLSARSKASNVRVFARSEATAAVRYDFNGHFARWERLVTDRKFYRSLRRAGDRRAVQANGQVAVFRTYQAVSLRNTKPQPYTVIVLAAHSPRLQRAYTLAIAAHAPTFAKYKARLQGIAASFAPVGAPKPVLAKARPMSLRGKLVRKPSGVVAAKAVAGKAFARQAPGRRPAVKPAPKAVVKRAVVKPAPKAVVKRPVKPVPKALVKRPAVKPAPKAVVKRPVKPAPKALVKRPVKPTPKALVKKPAAKSKAQVLTSTKKGAKAKSPSVKKPAAKPVPKAPKVDVPSAATEPVSLLSGARK